MSVKSENTLSLAYMRGHPAQAARVLEALPAEAAAALFARVPARTGSAVLAAMLPQAGARCVETLDDTRALELLTPMGTQPTVALLRHLPEVRRGALIAGLPTATALASKLLLGYSDDTLGAWADPDVVTLGAQTRVADALERMRRTHTRYPLLLVADYRHCLTGMIALTDLLQAPAGASLATLSRPANAVLIANAPLSGAAAHPGWQDSSILPVVEPGDRLLGIMTRDALSRALRRRQVPVAGNDKAGLSAVFALGYWQALAGLLESGLALLPRVPAVAESGTDER